MAQSLCGLCVFARDIMIQTKKERMIEWMLSDALHGRRDFRDNKGFMVTDRICVQRKDGRFQPITEILKELGFVDREVIAGYRVRYQDKSAEYPEAYQFFSLQPPIPEPDFL